VIVAPTALDRLGRDQSHLVGVPWAAVRPKDSDDVVALVGWARTHHVALVARGAGTSLEGESVVLPGGVVVDFSQWSRIHHISPERRSVRVGPGVVNRNLQSALCPFGMFYPPNPGSADVCTIGGNIGTNASGPRSFAYGPTRRWVRALDVVLGTGERARFGNLTEKRSVGPDLLQLMIGSEGTLGIVTEITLRLAPLPCLRQGWVIPLAPTNRLGPVAMGLARARGTGLSAVEYLDGFSADGLREGRGAGWRPGSPLLLLEIESDTAAESQLRARRVREALRAADVRAPPIVFPDADRLWNLRGENGRVLDERVGPRVREDVAVPLDRIDELIAGLRRIARRERVPLYLFGHLGEGSLHPNYAVDPVSPTADRIRTAVWEVALALQGTISAEHGVGRLKRAALEAELGPEAVRLLESVRQACDPDGILNPGKLYPDRRGPASPPSRSRAATAIARARSGSPIDVARLPAGAPVAPRRRATGR
jgi:D-lactate dehydrogenase